MDFSADERLLLQTVCRYFHKRAEWPTYDYLDRMLSVDREDFLVETVGKRLESFMYQGAGWYVPSRGWEPEAQVHLSISAIYTCYKEGVCPELGEDLDALVQVVQLCIETYRARSDAKPKVTSADVRDHFNMPDLMLRKVFDLVSRAGLAFGSSYSDARNGEEVQWTVTISPDVRYYRHLHMATIGDFMRVYEHILDEQRRIAQPATLPNTSVEVITLDPEDISPPSNPGDVTSMPIIVELRPISLFPRGPFTRDDQLCFVLMPFAEELQPVYDDAIMPAATQMGLKCVRADEISKPGGIMAQVWEQLMQARVVIADLTDKNANVFYELGLAHTIGHDVILLTQDMKWVPFDLRHMRCIVYQPDASGLQILEQKLRLAILALVQ